MEKVNTHLLTGGSTPHSLSRSPPDLEPTEKNSKKPGIDTWLLCNLNKPGGEKRTSRKSMELHKHSQPSWCVRRPHHQAQACLHSGTAGLFADQPVSLIQITKAVTLSVRLNRDQHVSPTQELLPWASIFLKRPTPLWSKHWPARSCQTERFSLESQRSRLPHGWQSLSHTCHTLEGQSNAKLQECCQHLSGLERQDWGPETHSSHETRCVHSKVD